MECFMNVVHLQMFFLFLLVLSLLFVKIVYNRVSRGMLHDDRIVLSVLLSRIYLKGFAE